MGISLICGHDSPLIIWGYESLLIEGFVPEKLTKFHGCCFRSFVLIKASYFFRFVQFLIMRQPSELTFDIIFVQFLSILSLLHYKQQHVWSEGNYSLQSHLRRDKISFVLFFLLSGTSNYLCSFIVVHYNA